MKSLKTILTIVIAVIGVIGALLYILLLTDSDPENSKYLNWILRFGEVLVFVTTAIAMFFALKNIATDSQKLKKSLISLAVLAILGLLAYGIANGDLRQIGDKISISEGTSKLVGAGLYMFYFLAALALLLLAGFGIKKAIK